MQSISGALTTDRVRKGRERMSIENIDLSDFKTLLSQQPPNKPNTSSNEKPKQAPPANTVTPPKTLVKVVQKFVQREKERQQNRSDFPDDYFFSSLAEFVLDD